MHLTHSPVESRTGDDMRFGSGANEWEKRGLAAPWIAVNAGKRSITLDLKKPKAIEVIKRLREWSKVPVLVLSVLGQDDKKIAALDAQLA